MWAGIALLALYAAYLLAGNAFLRSASARDLVNRKPGTFQMQWRGGHTLWPGRIVLRDVRLRGQAGRIAWELDARTVRGRIALWPLLAREVRVPWVEAGQVSGSVARAEQRRPRPARREGGWTLRMDRIASDSVLGGSVFGWRIQGPGRAEVGFRKQFRGGPVEMFPSSAHFDAARVLRDGEEWLVDARIDARFALASHLPGADRLRLLSARLGVDARTVALQAALGGDGRYTFSTLPGEGRLEAELSLADGALRAGDRLRVHAPLRFVDATGAASDSALDLTLEVDDALHLRAQVPDQADQGTWLQADLRVPGVGLALDDARERLMRSTGHARGRWYVPSLAGLLALFARTDWLDLQGSGTVEADLRLDGGQLADGSWLRVREVEAHADVLGNRFSGRAHADAAIEAGEGGVSRSRVSLVMDRFAAAPASAPRRPWIRGNNLRLDIESDAQLERMRETLRARLRFRDASVPELAVFNPYLPNGRVRFVGGGGRLDGDLRVDGEGEVGEGSLRVDARQTRLSVAGLALQGDVVVDGRLRRGDLHKGDFDLGGTTIRLRKVAFSERGGAARKDWWADVDMPQGQVAWTRPASAGGELRARMKNVDFLLAMFADRADYPAWIGRLVDDGEATVSGDWQWKGDALVLDRIHAANQRFQVDARLRLQGQHRQGELYARWGVLGVGLELGDGKPKLHLRGARAWYDSQPDLLE